MINATANLKDKKIVLTRVYLINWFKYLNNIITIDPISNAIVGENGAGKTIIIDAICHCITASDNYMNQAAGKKLATEKKKRDIRSLHRGGLNKAGTDFNRIGPCVSDAVCEFYDAVHNQFFLVGGTIESKSSNDKLIKKWFLAENSKLEDVYFIENNEITFPESLQHRHKPQVKFTFFNKQEDALNRILSRLGNLHPNFINYFIKAIAYKPIEKMSELKDQLFDIDEKIDFTNIKLRVTAARKLQIEIQNTENKLNALFEILKAYERYEKRSKSKELLSIMEILSKLKKLKSEISDIEKNINVLTFEQKKLDEETLSLKEAIEEKSDELNFIKNSMDSNENHKKAEELKKDIDRQKKELNILMQAMKKYNSTIDNIINSCKSVYSKQTNMFKNIRENSISYNEQLEFLENTSMFFEEERANLKDKIYEIEREKREKNKQLSDIQTELNNLNRNVITYPKDCVIFLEEIEKEFKKRNIKETIYILIDLINIKEDYSHWQHSFEKALGDRRFDIVVPEQYLHIVHEVKECLVEQKKISRYIGYIDTKKINTNMEFHPLKENENSLAYCCDTNIGFVKYYVYEKIGYITMVETKEDLNKYNNSILPDGTTYSKHTFSYRVQQDFKLMIGKLAIEEQKKIKEAEKNHLTVDINLINTEIKQYQTKLNLINSLDIKYLKENFDIREKYEDCTKIMQDLEKDYTFFASDPTYFELLSKENVVRKAKADLEKKKSDKEKSYGEKSGKINSYNKSLSEKTAELDSLNFIYEEILENKEYLLNEAIQIYGEYSFSKIESEQKKNESSLVEENLNVKQRQKNFNELFPSENLSIGVEYIGEYQELYDKNKNSDLAEMKDRLKEEEKESYKEFVSTIAISMREKFLQGEKSVGNINRLIKNIRYGDESYQFVLSVKPEMQKHYDLFLASIDIQNERTLEVSVDEYLDKINETEFEFKKMFEELINSEFNGQLTFEKFFNYKNYYNIDVEVSYRDNIKAPILFSKEAHNFSGGEYQTPAYVMLIASLAKLYTSNSLRLLILDEAFPTMDDKKIEGLLKLIESMNFQYIILSPRGKNIAVEMHVNRNNLVYYDTESDAAFVFPTWLDDDSDEETEE